MKRLVFCAALFVSSCASAPTTVALPDGRVAYTVSCDGRRDSIANCMNAAASKCGGAYEVVDRQESSTLAAVDDMAVTIPRRDMIFVCKT